MSRLARYPAEVRERAVPMVFEREFGSQRAAISSISAKLCMTVETLRKWVRQAESDQGLRPGLSGSERERLKQLEREVREVRRATRFSRHRRRAQGIDCRGKR